MITIDSLTKKYGEHHRRHDISFTARSGRVTGFLGPERRRQVHVHADDGRPHARPTEGTATISGRLFADLPNPGREVGVMLDASAQHAGRTGREILTIARQIMGVPASRVAEMLDAGQPHRRPKRIDGCATTRSACASASASRPP